MRVAASASKQWSGCVRSAASRYRRRTSLRGVSAGNPRCSKMQELLPLTRACKPRWRQIGIRTEGVRLMTTVKKLVENAQD